MSHFTVAVLSDGKKTLEELLAPYQENNCGNVPRQFLEFHDSEEAERENWETGTRTMVDMNGRLYSPYDEVFKKPNASKYGFCSSDYEVPDELPRIEIPLKVLHPDYEAYLRECCGFEERDPETGKYGYWENPNAKWDWYEVGGRWEKWARETIGGTSIRVGDMRFDPTAERKKALRWWEENMEVETPDLFAKMRTNGLSKEQYLEYSSRLSFHAVVTPDGQWHEVGKMGWWGISSETAEDMEAWAGSFEETYLTDPDLTLTVVDCHI